MAVVVVVGLFEIFLNFLWLNPPNFLQYIKSGGIQISNMTKVGFVKAVLSIFANLCL